ALHLLLDTDLLGTIGPLHHRADALTLVADHRVGNGTEGTGAQSALLHVGAAQSLQHAALVPRVGAERVEAGALQALRLEVRQGFADLLLAAREGGLRGLVEIDDL